MFLNSFLQKNIGKILLSISGIKPNINKDVNDVFEFNFQDKTNTFLQGKRPNLNVIIIRYTAHTGVTHNINRFVI